MNYSRQREAILNNLKSRTDHPTADALFTSLREDFPHISLGTVYRNLALLCETGAIRRVSCEDGAERYDAFTDNHDHFVCKKCGKVIDLDGRCDSVIRSGAASDQIGSIESHSLIFYGICKECLSAQK